MITKEHFKRAAQDIGKYGDNDALPFDIENRFIKENIEKISELAYNFFLSEKKPNPNKIKSEKKSNPSKIKGLNIFSEKLLVPAGVSGFRVITKIHPFWSVYFNGLAISIADKIESIRSKNVYSYRFNQSNQTGDLFDQNNRWYDYCKATIKNINRNDSSVIIKTDISSFYERISHHHIENIINDVCDEKISKQIVDLLSKFSVGRSFGLPVGGQGARILAELFMTHIDSSLSSKDVRWFRYVDDFTLIGENQVQAYEILSMLSKSLADYGLSLNRTKTLIFSANHYVDFIKTQLEPAEDEQKKLIAINLHFDPYSDTAEEDYENLKKDANDINIMQLINAEQTKSQPDAFVIAQISRVLKYQINYDQILSYLKIFLEQKNINAFRASFPKIMRAVSHVRDNNNHKDIFDKIDNLLDELLQNAKHLLSLEGNCLFFIRTIRFKKTEKRSIFLDNLYSKTESETIKKECINCWRLWEDRAKFTEIKNKWENISITQKRMLWYAAKYFGDEGRHFKLKYDTSFDSSCNLGINREQYAKLNKNGNSFSFLYRKWCENDE